MLSTSHTAEVAGGPGWDEEDACLGADYQNVAQVAEGEIQSAQHLVHESLEGLTIKMLSK